jgi:hypothetical protein
MNSIREFNPQNLPLAVFGSKAKCSSKNKTLSRRVFVACPSKNHWLCQWFFADIPGKK